mmetsp:Transcript_95904/g.254774  ORF Transcript_95904/g.254774 Transcript_95904/m.254774 type:complete len:380 (-) Transcript_95904:852-1991(-)
MHVVQVDRVEPDRLLGALDGDVVDQTADHGHVMAAEIEHEVGDEYPDAKLLRCGLQAGGHVDVRREVRCVDLELAAYGALDGPATMQTEAHLHAVVGDALQQARVPAVYGQDAGLVDLGYNLDEGHDGHVRQLGLLLRARPGEAPDDEEGVADVLVRSPVEVVHAAVHNLAHLVHEDHDLLLQHLRRVCEVADAAEADDGVNLLPRHHRVHPSAVATLHVLPDDLGAGLAKTQREQSTKFDDGLLEDDRFHGLPDLFCMACPVQQLPEGAHLGELLTALHALDLFAPVLQVAKLHGLQWIVPDGLHLGDHALNRFEQQLVGIDVEGPHADANGKADEDGLEHAQPSLQLRRSPTIKGKNHVHVVLLGVGLHQRHEVFDL